MTNAAFCRTSAAFFKKQKTLENTVFSSSWDERSLLSNERIFSQNPNISGDNSILELLGGFFFLHPGVDWHFPGFWCILELKLLEFSEIFRFFVHLQTETPSLCGALLDKASAQCVQGFESVSQQKLFWIALTLEPSWLWQHTRASIRSYVCAHTHDTFAGDFPRVSCIRFPTLTPVTGLKMIFG